MAEMLFSKTENKKERKQKLFSRFSCMLCHTKIYNTNHLTQLTYRSSTCVTKARLLLTLALFNSFHHDISHHNLQRLDKITSTCV